MKKLKENTLTVIVLVALMVLQPLTGISQNENLSKGTLLEEIKKNADSLKKGTKVSPLGQNVDIARSHDWTPADAAPVSQAVDGQSRFDKGRFIEQDRDKYIATSKKEYIVVTGWLIKIGIIIVVIILYFVRGGLGKLLTKIR